MTPRAETRGFVGAKALARTSNGTKMTPQAHTTDPPAGLPPARPARAGRKLPRTLLAILRGVAWTVGCVALLWVLGRLFAAPLQLAMSPLPDELRVRRTQKVVGLSVYRAEALPDRSVLSGYRVGDEMPQLEVFPLAMPGQPPYERLLLVPTSRLFNVTYDMNSWWDLRGGDWSYVRTGIETAPDGTEWTLYERAAD